MFQKFDFQKAENSQFSRSTVPHGNPIHTLCRHKCTESVTYKEFQKQASKLQDGVLETTRSSFWLEIELQIK